MIFYNVLYFENLLYFQKISLKMYASSAAGLFSWAL